MGGSLWSANLVLFRINLGPTSVFSLLFYCICKSCYFVIFHPFLNPWNPSWIKIQLQEQEWRGREETEQLSPNAIFAFNQCQNQIWFQINLSQFCLLWKTGPRCWEAPVGPEGHKRFSEALFKLMLFPILNKGDTNHWPSAGSALQVASSQRRCAELSCTLALTWCCMANTEHLQKDFVVAVV